MGVLISQLPKFLVTIFKQTGDKEQIQLSILCLGFFLGRGAGIISKV